MSFDATNDVRRALAAVFSPDHVDAILTQFSADRRSEIALAILCAHISVNSGGIAEAQDYTRVEGLTASSLRAIRGAFIVADGFMKAAAIVNEKPKDASS